MSTAYTTYQQHEPLRSPSNWSTQEKRFVAQLEEIFDDIYRRFGRLRLEDMGDEFQKSFKAFSGDLSELQMDVEINAQGISTLTQKTGINSLGANETLYSKINVNAGNITTLVNKTGINSLGQNETLYSKISQSATDITTLVSKTGINSLGQSETLYSKINQNMDSVKLTFQKIGASGYTASGITTINENGITVTHSSISNCKTQMSANGFRILNSSNAVIGGLMSLNGSVVTAMNALYNPSYNNFRLDVGAYTPIDTEGTNSGHGISLKYAGTEFMHLGRNTYASGYAQYDEIYCKDGLYIGSGGSMYIERNNGSSIALLSNNMSFSYRDGNTMRFFTASQIYQVIQMVLP